MILKISFVQGPNPPYVVLRVAVADAHAIRDGLKFLEISG